MADRVAEPREVRVRVRVVPTDARLYVADVEFPNPMDAQQLRSTQPVALRVEADGYTTIERPLILDDDIALELQMSRVTSRVGRARRAATGQGSGSSETPASGPAEPDRRGVPDPGVRHEF